jgi:photosystem II stability/assembly factor-like uncharacterized protein
MTQTLVPIELLEQIERGNLLLFVGEGVNRGAPGERGLPSSAVLAAELARLCDYPADEPLTLARVAYLYERRFGRPALVERLRDELDSHLRAPLRAHRLIGQIPAPVIVTTTYDDMLDRVQRELGMPYVTVVRNQDVPYADRQKRLLIRLFGRMDQPESLVLTETDQTMFLDEQRGLSDVLRAELAQRTWLILGFDLNQGWFRALYDSVMRRLDSQGRRAYFYGDPPGTYIAEWCRERGIAVLTPDLTEFLAELTHKLDGRRLAEPPPIDDLPYPERPYKGLEAFTAADQRIFYGRERESQRLADLVRAHRLVLVYGPSGAGKTSLAQAGVAPLLERGKPCYTVVLARALGDPAQAIRAAVARRMAAEGQTLPGAAADGTLADFLAAAVQAFAAPLVLILDQFEEFFVEHGPELHPAFMGELAAIVGARDLPVKLLLSLREEWMGALGAFEQAIPTLYDTRVRLMPLDREAARAAIERPLEPFGVQFEPALVEQLLNDLGGEAAAPPQVQLVCAALYASLPASEHTITGARYVELGGAKGILQRFLKDELARVPAHQRDIARGVLEELVSSQGTKTPRAASELQRALATSADELMPVLHTLAGRLLRVIARAGAEPLYELAHEYLVGEIQPSDETRARKQAEELVAQGLGDWRRLGTLLGADEVRLIEKQQTRLRLSDDGLELLLRSAVQDDRPAEYWAARMSAAGRLALIERLYDDARSQKHAARRQACALLWTLRRYLPRRLAGPVYARCLAQEAPAAIRSAAIPSALVGVLLVLLSLMIPTVSTRWQILELIDAAGRHRPSIVAVSPTNADLIYVSDQKAGGFWWSPDGGMTWHDAGTGEVGALPVQSIALSTEFVYITTPSGVFFAPAGSAHWEPCASQPDRRPDHALGAIAAGPAEPARLFVAIDGLGVATTDRCGAPWALLKAPELPRDRITALATDGANVVVAAASGMAASRDAGSSWRSLDGTLPVTETVTGLAMPEPSTGYLLAAFGGQGLRYATGEWARWYALDGQTKNPLNVQSIGAVAFSGQSRYLVSERGLLCSRVWNWTEPNWWYWRFGAPVPCAPATS